MYIKVVIQADIHTLGVDVHEHTFMFLNVAVTNRSIGPMQSVLKGTQTSGTYTCHSLCVVLPLGQP